MSFLPVLTTISYPFDIIIFFNVLICLLSFWFFSSLYRMTNPIWFKQKLMILLCKNHLTVCDEFIRIQIISSKHLFLRVLCILVHWIFFQNLNTHSWSEWWIPFNRFVWTKQRQILLISFNKRDAFCQNLFKVINALSDWSFMVIITLPVTCNYKLWASDCATGFYVLSLSFYLSVICKE